MRVALLLVLVVAAVPSTVLAGSSQCFSSTETKSGEPCYGECIHPCGDTCCQTGSCNESSLTCTCDAGWSDYRCATKDCPNSVGYTNYSHNANPRQKIEWRGCDCAPGWTGQNCQVCSSSAACGANHTCEDTTLAYGQLAYTCSVTSPAWKVDLGGEGYVEIFCSDLTTTASATGSTAGSCSFFIYERQFQVGGTSDPFYPLLAYGQMSQCESYLTSAENVSISCEATEGMCGIQAGFILCGAAFKGIMKSLEGKSTIDCGYSAEGGLQYCTITLAKQAGIKMTCTPGTCLYTPTNSSNHSPHYIPPREPLLSTPVLILVVVGSSCLALTTMAVLRWCLCGACAAKTSRLSKSRDEEATALMPERKLELGAPAPCTLSIDSFSFSRNLSAHWYSSTSARLMLDSVYGEAGPGEILALMGASGAGKTTLLDCIAGRMGNAGIMNGSVSVNGRALTSEEMKLVSGYVQQTDEMMGSMTVEESVRFSAFLRLPRSMSRAEKEERVQKVLSELGLAHIRHSRIGDEFSRGISGGEKRRVSIALELVTSPSIIFLDEPTSGLDSNTALSVMALLRTLADRGHTIVCSIHQPSSAIFQTFDKLLLLRGGCVMYSGPAAEATASFATLGHVCPEHFNSADFLLQTIENINDAGATHLADVSRANYTGCSHTSSGAVREERAVGGAVNELRRVAPTGSSGRTLLPLDLDSRRAAGASWLTQLDLLCGRTCANLVRDPFLLALHFAILTTAGLLIGLIYYHLSLDLVAVQDRLGAFFFMCALLSFGSMSALELFTKERAIFVRERANGYYHPFTYYVSKVTFDLIPVRVFPTVMFASICYYMVGFVNELSHFLYFTAALILLHLTFAQYCFFIGTVTRSFGVGNVVTSLSILTSMLFGGFLVNPTTLVPWLRWLNDISPFNYAFRILMINEFAGLTILFNPPDNFSASVSANLFLEQFQIEEDKFAHDFVVLTSFFASLLVLTYITLLVRVREVR